MNEPNPHEATSASRPISSSPKASRGRRYIAADPSHDARLLLTQPGHFPKDDRRSSALLTEREQSERWPLG